MSGRGNNTKVKAPQHQNDAMMKELRTLRNEIGRLQESLRSHEERSAPDPAVVKASSVTNTVTCPPSAVRLKKTSIL